MSVSVAKFYPSKPCPKKQGYTNILIHTGEKGLGAGLSPYRLEDEQGRILENIWQFSKWYPFVEAQCIPYSRYKQTPIIWDHPKEIHCINNEPTDEYWNWREKGMNNKYAVRYPVGYNNRHNCICALWPESPNSDIYDKLDYLSARKKIYVNEYIRLHKNVDDFHILQEKLSNGENLQIIEVDGPDPTLDYFPYNLLSVNDPGLVINKQIIKALINDTRKPFGHGYTIAALLLDKEKWLK
jgi:hypothetical protein